MSIACIHNENAADCVCGCAGLVAAVRADERERIAQEIEAAAQRLRDESGGSDLNLGQWSGLNRMADTFEMAADIARGLS